MISQKLQNAINEQINSEFYAAHLYLTMAAFCDTRSLGGFSLWLKLQYSEELSHALKLFDFITDRGGRVVLQAIRQPPVEERDYSAHVLLEWFVDEQVEEEKSLTEIIDHLEMIGNDGTGAAAAGLPPGCPHRRRMRPMRTEWTCQPSPAQPRRSGAPVPRQWCGRRRGSAPRRPTGQTEGCAGLSRWQPSTPPQPRRTPAR